MKDLLNINEFATRNVEIQASPQEFFNQHWYIESVGIISTQIAILNKLTDLIGNSFEIGSIFHHLIGNAVQVGRALRNRHFRIDQPTFNCLISINSNPYDRDLNNT